MEGMKGNGSQLSWKTTPSSFYVAIFDSLHCNPEPRPGPCTALTLLNPCTAQRNLVSNTRTIIADKFSHSLSLSQFMTVWQIFMAQVMAGKSCRLRLLSG